MTAQITKTQLLQHFKSVAAKPLKKSKAIDLHLNPKTTETLIPAAVLVPIIDEPTGLSVLFTVRTSHLKHHAGQISFPGGRKEPGDPTLISAALRETTEETGLQAQQIEVLGQLPAVSSSTGYLVTPFVALVTPPLDLHLDPMEVDRIFVTPLAFLLDKNNQQQEMFLSSGKQKQIHVIEYEKHRIWGMTARIIVELTEELKEELKK